MVVEADESSTGERMNIGLTLGKYAPLHAGHQYVIETALREMDVVYVLIYDEPTVTPIPLPVRAGWIRALYPNVHVIEAWDGPTESGYTPEIMAMHDAYIKQCCGDLGITHFYSSEPYGDHVSRGLGAVNRQVDPPRLVYPISATMVRRDTAEHRAMVNPLVYRDLITKVVLLGAPSTGKTTLAAALAETFRTNWMPEYGREYWEHHQHDRRLSPRQLLEIAKGHRVREEAAFQQAEKYCFIDTNALTTAMFGMSYHGYVLPSVAALADACQRRYDVFLLCADDIPYDDTWDRSGEVSRRIFQKQIRADLQMRHIPFTVVTGTLEDRVAQVRRLLEAQESQIRAS